jgi:indolepyruvate ferredoxin oxidoreductase beta subunit
MQGSFLFLNVLILGAMCGRDLGDFSLEELKEAVSELSPDRFRDLNLKAVDLGFREMKDN